jgi:Mg-chelatase subunit ChlD
MNGATILGAWNWALVLPYLEAAKVMPDGDDFFESWLHCAPRLADSDIDLAVTFLEQTPGALASLGKESVLRWGEQAREAMKYGPNMWKAAKAYLEEAVADRCGISLARWRFNLRQASGIAAQSPSAAEEFIRSGTRVCLLLNKQDTKKWVQEGLTSCGTQAELTSYFRGSSLKALDFRDGLIQGVTLKERLSSLSLICEAYLGRPVKIRSNRALIGVKGFSLGPVTDGRVIYLPEVAPSFGLIKLMALHQATLLDMNGWQEALKDKFQLPADIHREADRRLVAVLPGMAREMKKAGMTTLPESYPDGDYNVADLPWWGDLLPHLIAETENTIRRVKEGLPQLAELPPELVEMLLNSLLAQGERDPDSLLAQLGLTLENMDFSSPDAEELGQHMQSFFYKEWDNNLSDYKLDWCLVRQWTSSDSPNPFAKDLAERLQGIINLLRRQFMKLKPERFRKFKAQSFGDELDLEALVTAIVEMRSGSFLSDKVYVRRDKRVRDVAVLFLVDLSGSTEEDLNGRRVVDIQKEAMTLMAEALDSLGDPFAIYGFSSEGRFRVDFLCVKGFNEAYGDTVRHRLGNLEPRNLTRMGAVIRHATQALEAVSAGNKLMVILTDGRPYDIEYGTLDYAMADTRKAIKEARSKKIHPFIITSDKRGAAYLKQICPQTQSVILPRAEILPQVLPAIYRRLTV